MKRPNNIKLSQGISVQVAYRVNSNLVVVLRICKTTSFRIWFVAISVVAKLIVKSKVKGIFKNTRNSSICYLVSEKLFFSHHLSVGLALNLHTLVPTALNETYNIPVDKDCNQFFFRNIKSMDSRISKLTISLLLEKYNRFIVFSEHKLYRFPHSVLVCIDKLTFLFDFCWVPQHIRSFLLSR